MVRIAFFGTPDFSVASLEKVVTAGHNVVTTITKPDRPSGRGHKLKRSPLKSASLALGIPVLQPDHLNDPFFLERLSSCRIDLGVVVAYGMFLSETILGTPHFGTINVHASLLPKYRGAAPVHRAIINGEQDTGVTVIRLVQRMDAGPILSQSFRAIANDETSGMVENDLATLGADLLVGTIGDISAGRVKEEPQDESLATFAPRLTKEDGRIDWTIPAKSIHNLVRGLHPWPHAFSYLNGSRYLILRTTVSSQSNSERKRSVGKILEASGDQIHVSCGGGTVLEVRELQPEGRRRLRVKEFLAGHPINLPSTFRPFPLAE